MNTEGEVDGAQETVIFGYSGVPGTYPHSVRSFSSLSQALFGSWFGPIVISSSKISFPSSRTKAGRY
jgi:hypothetical protein